MVLAWAEIEEDAMSAKLGCGIVIRRKPGSPSGSARPGALGFTLIELMIVVAVLAILLSVALPAYSNYVVRSKIAEGLSVAMAAKTAAATACQEDLTLTTLTNAIAGYSFDPPTQDETYVEDVDISGECTEPVITITTRQTGLAPDPVITLTGDFTNGAGRINWICASDNTPNHHLPSECRT